LYPQFKLVAAVDPQRIEDTISHSDVAAASPRLRGLEANGVRLRLLQRLADLNHLAVESSRARTIL
jgi:hypothetical protein